MADEFDPYHVWLGIPPNQQPPTHYRLLGIEQFESNPDVIDAAASRQTAYLHQLASGPNRKASQQILNEVAAARRCLLNSDSKKSYDQQLQQINPQGESHANDASATSESKSPQRKNSTSTTADSLTKSGSRIARCGTCNARIQASQAKLDRGVKCPKCGNEVRLQAASPVPEINIDTTGDSPARVLKERKIVPWWAHPISLCAAGTILLLFVAGIGKWITTPDTQESLPQAEVEPKDESDPIEKSPSDVASPDDPTVEDFFVVDFKQATTKGKWTTAAAPAGFVGAGFVTSNDAKASIRFDFKPPASAAYEVRLRYRTNKRYGNAVPVKFQVRNVPENIKLNMKQAVLGNEGYRFLGVKFLKANEPAFVELKVAGAGGLVYAESVEFIRREGVDIGLCGYWPMEQAQDRPPAEIGGVTAIIEGGESVPGAVGKALRLQSDSQFRLGAEMVHPTQGTIAFWLRQDSTKPVVFLSTTSEEAKDAEFRIQTVAAGNELKLAVQVSPSPQSPGIPIDQTIEPQRWYHVVLSWQEGGDSQVFCNGRFLGQRQKTPKVSRVPIRLVPNAGKDPDQIVLIDELRAYRLRCLNEADALQLYKQANSK